MSRLPADLFFDYIHADEVSAAHDIEIAEFPSDEAATFQQFQIRHELAPYLFLGAFVPPSSPDSKRDLIGYVCATRSGLSTLTEDSMKRHEPSGTSVCIHGVVIASQYQRRGVALALLKEFIYRVQIDGLSKRVLLICHESMLPLYEKAGLEYVGRSPVVHGSLPWHEMRIALDEPYHSESRKESGSTVSLGSNDAISSSASGPLPPGLLNALQQASSSRSRLSSRLLSSFSGGVSDVTSGTAEVKTNKFDILCPRPGCGSIILKAGVGSLLEKDLPELGLRNQPSSPLLSPLLPEGTRASCWLIQPSPMAFENIGFSRAVDGTLDNRGVRTRLKLLSCADCDLGPLGWCVEGEREFWLLCDRVGYRV